MISFLSIRCFILAGYRLMTMNNKIVIAFIAILMLLLCVPLTAQNVTNVTAEQVDKTIHVSYDLDKAANITLFLSTDGGKTYKELYRVDGAVGKNVTPGHRTIIWNVLEEVENLKGDDYVFKVKATAFFSCGVSTIRDYDGNVYNTVLIGEQCWMKENLRTTHYSDGTSIALGNTTSETIGYRYYPNNSKSNVSTYGYLYNWKAVMHNSSSSSANPSGVQGICPKGWHMPSDAEWTQLTNYVSSQNANVCGSHNSYIAKSLALSLRWENNMTHSCAVGDVTSTNNSTGFSAVPAGSCSGYPPPDYYYFGSGAFFWSSSESKNNSNLTYNRYIYSSTASVFRDGTRKSNGFSVRCVCD